MASFQKNTPMRRLPKCVKIVTWICLAWLVVVLGSIPIKFEIAKIQQPDPQAILALGGGERREIFTAAFAKTRPQLDIWVSTGQEEAKARAIFANSGIDNNRVYLDYQAIDTVTNFTSLVQEFKARHLKHLYLITSDYHMPRAKAVATVVLGSQGIAITPVAIPSIRPPEPVWKKYRDIVRALTWVLTHRTGSSLHPLYREQPLTPISIP